MIFEVAHTDESHVTMWTRFGQASAFIRSVVFGAIDPFVFIVTDVGSSCKGGCSCLIMVFLVSVVAVHFFVFLTTFVFFFADYCSVVLVIIFSLFPFTIRPTSENDFH